jgi:predicted DNA-binding transcriptional regulator YafY
MESNVSPTARALLTLELIGANPGITAERLSGMLGVSERAARRYVSILREAEIPIDSFRGPYGGYVVGQGARLPPLRFSAAEALGLVMAVLDGHHQASDPGNPVGSALGKIMRALPEPVAAQAEAIRATAAPAPDRSAVRCDPATAAALVQACSNRQPVRLSYRQETGRQLVIDVDPWAVVVRHGRWYLLCWSHGPGGRRAYRIDRIAEIAAIDGTFEPPAGLDPVALLEEHLAVGWDYQVEIVIEAGLAAVAHRVPRILGRLEKIDEETTRLTGSTSNPAWYAEQLAQIPAPYRIAGSAEVRQAVLALGHRLMAAAQPDPPPDPPRPAL